MGWDVCYQLAYGSLLAAGLVSFIILIKTLVDFSRTGPKIEEKILKSYRLYSVYAISRLFAWCFIINLYLAITGNLFYFSLTIISNTSTSELFAVISGLLAILFFTSIQFLKHLFFIPSNIASSSLYSMKNFYKIWRWLSPLKLRVFDYTYKLVFLLVVSIAIFLLN